MTDTTDVLPTKKPAHNLERYAEAELPTEHGSFRMLVFKDKRNGREQVALVRGEVAGLEGVPVRIHSECLTGEAFGSLRCDCREQLSRAMKLISQNGHGVVVYLRQEGRGIGLGNKIKAYALQSDGADTYEANRLLGFPDDLREYGAAAEILRFLQVRSVDLVTNNPMKIAGLVEEGVPVRRRIPSRAGLNPHNLNYLKTKRERSGHLIELFAEEDSEAETG
ncbi:MAG: GTP cyclohydrolase II [Myxococcales bacterium]|nr:GTP cyclohydrolase II [Myxococcales bacterium]